MTPNEVQEFKDEIRGSHQSLSDQITQLKNQIEPIAKVYDSFQGWGMVTEGIFKWIIVPSSIIIGLVLSIKKLLH